MSSHSASQERVGNLEASYGPGRDHHNIEDETATLPDDERVMKLESNRIRDGEKVPCSDSARVNKTR